jgi:hypothetical protein
MVKYDSRRGSRHGPGAYGSRRDSRYGGRGSRDDRYGRRSREDDEYEEEPYYGEPAKRKMSHEQVSFIILAVVVVFIIIVIIASMARQSVSVPTARLEKEFAVTGEKKEAREHQDREEAASKLLGDARYFDQANPYEDKEVVAEKYREVYEKYPNTKASEEARKKYDEVMDRRK